MLINFADFHPQPALLRLTTDYPMNETPFITQSDLYAHSPPLIVNGAVRRLAEKKRARHWSLDKKRVRHRCLTSV